MILSIPDGFILHIWIPGCDDANQRPDFGILLDFHGRAVCWLKDGRLVYVWHAYADDGLVSESAEVNKARVDVLIHGFDHNIVCPFALKVQLL